MKKFEIAIIFGFIFSVIASSISGFALECDTMRNSVLRLHIIANSDSEIDQQLKLAVRDSVLNATGEMFYLVKDKEEAVTVTNEHREYIENIAKSTVLQRGFNYSVRVKLVNMYFETREYDNVVMPAGYYDAVRIEIGEAKGKNWWCVLFPPMCLSTAMSDKSVTKDQNRVIAGGYEIRFAIVEALESLIKRFKRLA